MPQYDREKAMIPLSKHNYDSIFFQRMDILLSLAALRHLSLFSSDCIHKSVFHDLQRGIFVCVYSNLRRYMRLSVVWLCI